MRRAIWEAELLLSHDQLRRLLEDALSICDDAETLRMLREENQIVSDDAGGWNWARGHRFLDRNS